MKSKRFLLVAATAGLSAGLGLGITGLASAAGSSPTPKATPKAGNHPDGRGGPHDRANRGPGGPGGFGGFGGFKGGPGRGNGFGLPTGGLVTAVSGDSLTVDSLGGPQKITLNSTTTYLQGKDTKTSAILKPGEIVAVVLVDRKATTPVAKSVIVLPSHLSGWITTVADGTITITDDSGFSRTIKTTGATTYTKDGKAATVAIATVGTFITGLGAVDADGTTLDATAISTGRGGKGFDGFGGGHPGFRGGPKPGATPMPKPS